MRWKKSWVLKGRTFAVIVAFLLAPCAAAASTYKVLHRFTGLDGDTPYDSLVFDSAGNLYGTTSLGGVNGAGTVFKLTPNSNGSWTETVLYNFSAGADGYFPVAGVTLDSAGNLYGAAIYNSGGSGTVFKLTANSDGSWTPSVLHTFTGADGGGPYGNLAFDAAGNLYGTTISGGSSAECSGGCGVVFKLAPNPDGSWTESVLHSFTGTDGQLPRAGVIFDATGSLYSTTAFGGAGDGTVFKLIPNADGSWSESTLHRFTGADGAIPYDALIFDAAGNLYGTASGGGSSSACSTSGCGVVFKLTPKSDGSWKETVIHNFARNPSAVPVGGLIFDAAGNLYGTTWSGGASGDIGTVFKLTPNSNGSWAFTALHVFAGTPAMQPYDSLVLDKAGNLYGTTSACGSGAGCSGTVFEITP
jgi:uncharacterized repeat protein (TIGR03803 family)